MCTKNITGTIAAIILAVALFFALSSSIIITYIHLTGRQKNIYIMTQKLLDTLEIRCIYILSNNKFYQ